jgi:UDP-N-acetylmuramoyl-L-alanyl-D-glutamate--2,6-diaminopimelate ligase
MGAPLLGLCQAVGGETFGELEGVLVREIQVDSRRIRPGDLFAALPGTRTVGSAYVDEALARGAQSLLLPAGTPPPPGVPGLWSPAPRRTLSELAAELYGHPSHRVAVTGVTGSNGKTTVATMLRQILTSTGKPAGLWSTSAVDSGARRFRPALTTPEAPDLHRFLAEVAGSGMGWACIEVSSHAVVQERVSDVRFAGGAITSVTADHLDFHGSFAAYLAAKRAFVQSLPEGALLAYNLDDPGAAAASRGARARMISCGFSPEADMAAVDAHIAPDGSACTVRLAPRLAALGGALGSAPSTMRLTVPLPGRHNLTNAMLAAALALAAGSPPAGVQAALAAFRPPARRLRATWIGPHLLLDDVAMNQASFEAVLSTVAQFGLPRLVVVVAPRGNRGAVVNREAALALARWIPDLGWAPVVVTLSEQAVARYPLDYRVRPEEAEAFLEGLSAGNVPYRLHRELDSAIADAVGLLGPEGALLLLGTFGMDEGLALAERLLGAEGSGPTYSTPSFA